MSDIQWKTVDDKYVITLDKSVFDKSEFLEILQWLRVRYLLKKGQFDEGVEELGEEILSDWWEKNKHRFIPAES